MDKLIQIDDFEIRPIKVDDFKLSIKSPLEDGEILPYSAIPSEIRISTITILSQIPSRVDLQLLWEHTPVFPKSPVLNVRYFDRHARGIFRVRRENTSTRNLQMFLNQITFDVMISAERVISAKLFRDGKIQLAGCRTVEESHLTLARLVSVILPCEHIIASGKMEIRCFDEERDQLLHLRDKISKQDWRDVLNMFRSRRIPPNSLSQIPMQVFEYERKAIERPISGSPEDYEIEIVMINSDFDSKVFIDKDKLIRILKDKYNLHCRPNSSRYPGINAKYVSCVDCGNHCETQAQRKKCADMRKKKRLKEGCVTVSILAFSQGKIILTGARSLAQLRDAYDFMTKIFRDDYQDFGKNY